MILAKGRKSYYADKHMLLLRNKFFKSCAFRTKLQKWIKDKNITLDGLEWYHKNTVAKPSKNDIIKREVKQAFSYANKGVIFHSDRGSQYTSEKFRKTLKKYGIIQSLSGTGRCYDNARMESFFATLKKELLYKIPTYKMTKAEVTSKIYHYVFAYYNTIRINTSNPGGLPPMVYRELYYKNNLRQLTA